MTPRGRCPLVGLLLVLLLAVAVLFPVASGVNFLLNYSDPANDVMVLYSNNNTPVLTAGSYTFTVNHPDIDVNWIRTRDNGTSVKIHFEMRGDVVNRTNTSYSVNLYSDATNRTHYTVNYTNGNLWLNSNATGFTPRNITGNATITSSCVVFTGRPNVICITVAKSLLGGAANITAWNVDGTAVMRGNPAQGQLYTYQDFGWQVPGNPGSIPTVIQGHVFKVGTTQPLPGVNVSTDLSGYWTLTDAAGAYILNVAPGTYNVTASLKGYYPQTMTVTLVQGQGVILDFALTPKPTILQGHVYIQGTTQGIPGVKVTTDLGGYSVQTDATGAFSMEVTPGTYNVTATSEGFYPQTVVVTLAQGDAVTQDFPLAPIPVYQTSLGLGLIMATAAAVGLLLLFLLWHRRRRRREVPSGPGARGPAPGGPGP